MYHKILVPLDGSPRAEAILPHVESLAHTYGAQIILLGVVEPLYIAHESIYRNPLFDQQNIEQLTAGVEEYLQTMQTRLRQQGIETKRIVTHQYVVNSILNTAQAEEVDLIAMTSHGRTGLSRVFYGSVAAGVLHQIDRPLLLIRSLDNP
ncbi:MAG: universal stress protein [Anaerolineae bacterium]|nr:universal stress protein [Anaerolineae bacterium]